MKKQKGFISVVLIIIGVLVIGGGSYVYINNETQESIVGVEVEKNIDNVEFESAVEQKDVSTTVEQNSPSITVLSPNGGEVYQQGTSVIISWRADNLGDKTIEIDLLKSDNTEVYNLTSMEDSLNGSWATNVGPASYSWHIPSPGSPGGVELEPGNYKISIETTDNLGISDVSDSFFTVEQKNINTSIKEDTAQDMGIQISNIKDMYFGKLPINIKGSVTDNKKWRIFEGNAGVVEVYGTVNGVEKKIAESPISLSDFDYDKKPPFYFDIYVGDRQYISEIEKEEGYMIIKESGVKDADVIDNIIIPIKFDILQAEKNITQGCLEFDDPLWNSRITFPLVITGNVNNKSDNCNWVVFEGQGGTAQIYYQGETSWKKIGNESIIMIDNWTEEFPKYEVDLNFNNSGIDLSSGHKLKIVFTSENVSGIPGKVSTIEVPVILK